MAWAPDPSAFVPTGEIEVVQKGQVHDYPVLGSTVVVSGEQLCAMGDTTGREVCGKVDHPYNSSNTLVLWHPGGAGVSEGDSGGPVYEYVNNPDGSVKGVLAVGLTDAVDH